jgi:endonuclease YncB( thermonuclease family)
LKWLERTLLGVQTNGSIRGSRLILRSSIFSRVGVSALIAIVVLCTATVDLGARGGSKEWIVLKDCRLIANPANDGDSFHVSAGDKEYLFRLYFVDAPETDAMVPGRLVEQAKYFGITVPQAIEVGRAAKEFTQEKLSQPFTVFTHMSDAMGSSRLPRVYVFVQTKEGDLGEQLVRDGLARPYGFKAAPPGLQSSRIEVEKLQQFEDEARQEKLGGWGVNVGRVNVRPANLPAFNQFVLPDKARPLSTPARGPEKSYPKEKTPLGQININIATEEELRRVPGIGHVMAARIIAARPFRSADDLKRVSGIGDKRYAQIRPYFQ